MNTEHQRADAPPSNHSTTTVRSGTVRCGARVAVVAAVLAAVAGLGTATVDAATYRVTRTGGVGVAYRAEPRLAARAGYGIPEGGTVTLICQTWGDAVGQHQNRLWWKVDHRGRQMFVADTYLSTPNRANQPLAGQPWCGTNPAPAPPSGPSSSIAGAEQAIRWMQARLGDTSLDGWCLRAVRLAYESAGRNIGSAPSAFDYWQRNPSRQRGGAAPRGALVFFDGYYQGGRYGHVGIALGDGRYISTYDRTGRSIHVGNLAGRASYLGHIVP